MITVTKNDNLLVCDVLKGSERRTDRSRGLK